MCVWVWVGVCLHVCFIRPYVPLCVCVGGGGATRARTLFVVIPVIVSVMRLESLASDVGV